jgi:hypothetical protein
MKKRKDDFMILTANISNIDEEMKAEYMFYR